jgi:hypothetical protein
MNAQSSHRPNDFRNDHYRRRSFNRNESHAATGEQVEQYCGPQGRGRQPGVYFGDCSDFAFPGGVLCLADSAGLRLGG